MKLLLVINICLFSALTTIYADSECSLRSEHPCVCFWPHPKKVVNITCDHVTTTENLKVQIASNGATPLVCVFLINSKEVTTLPSGIFGSLNSTELLLIRNGLSWVDDDVFQEMKNDLGDLNLASNNFTRFNFKSLQNLTRLYSFSLNNNGLNLLPKDAFQSNPDLGVINLSHNKISDLHKETFENLPYLNILNLCNNKITTIGEKVFSLPNALMPLSLKLCSNLISSIHKDAFKDLKLVDLDLSDNDLEILDQDVYEPLVNYMLSEITAETGIFLHDNLFKCDCSMFWLVKKEKKYRSRFVALKCEETGKRVARLKEKDFDC